MLYSTICLALEASQKRENLERIIFRVKQRAFLSLVHTILSILTERQLIPIQPFAIRFHMDLPAMGRAVEHMIRERLNFEDSWGSNHIRIFFIIVQIVVK